MLAIARCQYQIFKEDLHYMKFFTISFFILLQLEYKLTINKKKNPKNEWLYSCYKLN